MKYLDFSKMVRYGEYRTIPDEQDEGNYLVHCLDHLERLFQKWEGQPKEAIILHNFKGKSNGRVDDIDAYSKHHDEIEEWLKTECKGEYAMFDSTVWIFEIEDDAMRFKLTWA